jgi:hypothetical protein
MKTTRQIYCQYLLSSQINYTCTNLADQLEGLDHNRVYRYLKHEKLTPAFIWEKVKNQLVLSENASRIFDDTVLDKSYSFASDGVRRQYSGNAHARRSRSFINSSMVGCRIICVSNSGHRRSLTADLRKS